MGNKRYSELLLGIIMFLLAGIYFFLTKSIEGAGGIDSRFLPFILSAILIILASLQTLKGVKILKEGYKIEEDLDYLTFLKTLSLIVLYIGFLSLLGFILSTIIFLFLEFIVLTPEEESKNYGLYIIISVATSLVVYFLFRSGLNLILPKGIIGGI